MDVESLKFAADKLSEIRIRKKIPAKRVYTLPPNEKDRKAIDEEIDESIRRRPSNLLMPETLGKKVKK